MFLVQIQEIEFMWLGNEKREVDPRSELINGGNYGRIFLFLFSLSQFLSFGEGQIRKGQRKTQIKISKL